MEQAIIIARTSLNPFRGRAASKWVRAHQENENAGHG
jgi:hypothetical protein